MQYLLAHDLGTSADKAVLYTIKGDVAAEVTAEYPTYYPFERAAEQDPEDWWRAFCRTTKELLEKADCRAADILAVSFSAQMNSCLPVDREGKPLRRAMIWADQRADREAGEIAERVGLDTVYRTTGHRLSASYGIAKMAWFKRNEPDLYRRTAKFILPKDYLVFRLTGRLVSDYSDASHLACLNLQDLTWSEDILRAATIEGNKMPELLRSIDPAGAVSREASACCGLAEGTMVVLGGGDGACATAGAGISRPGQTYCSLGTSAWILTLFEKPYLDPQKRIFNLMYLDGRQAMSLGASQAAGLSLSWAVDTLFSEFKDTSEVYRNLDKLVGDVPAGSEGLLFLPYLLGERSPWWNPGATGCFVGLRPVHRREALLRAVLEGVGHTLKLILDALGEGCDISELSVIGGGARNRAWLQILADIWQKPVQVPRLLQYAASAGAAICAGVGAGVLKGLDDAGNFNPNLETLQPNPGQAATYAGALKRFKTVYLALEKADFSTR